MNPLKCKEERDWKACSVIRDSWNQTWWEEGCRNFRLGEQSQFLNNGCSLLSLFLVVRATWSKLAALLPQNNVFCLQEEVSARSWNSSFTSQADWLIAARACGRKSEDNISAAWLYETCLHGEETSHLLRLEPRLTNIPCTPFNDVTHARCQNPHAELTHPPSKVRMPWTGCTYCWSLWRAVFTQMLSLACQPCTKAQPEEHLPGQGRVWCFAAPGTLCLPGLGRAHEEKWKGRAKHLQVLVLCKDI